MARFLTLRQNQDTRRNHRPTKLEPISESHCKLQRNGRKPYPWRQSLQRQWQPRKHPLRANLSHRVFPQPPEGKSVFRATNKQTDLNMRLSICIARNTGAGICSFAMSEAASLTFLQTDTSVRSSKATLYHISIKTIKRKRVSATMPIANTSRFIVSLFPRI